MDNTTRLSPAAGAVAGARRRPGRQVVMFAVASMLIGSTAGLLITDRLAGLALAKHVDLIFPSNTVVTHETSEFKYTARINSMGFRDHEVGAKVPGRRRVVVIGDSFVYGWGVEIEQSWPKVLEAQLEHAGKNVEIFDLGFPGGGPTEYAQVAHRAIPALSPDLVIIGSLQGDDVMQEHIKGDKLAPVLTKSRRRQFADIIAPNIASLISGERHLAQVAVPESALRGSYKKQVARLLSTLTPEQLGRLESIDPTAHRMWVDGDLNPYIIVSAMKTPDYFAFTLEPDRADVQKAIGRMATAFEQIASDARRVGATTIVVSEPYPAYVIDGFVQRLGFSLPASAGTSTAPDGVIESACARAQLRCESVTSLFRNTPDRASLYFEFDGHPTPAGHELLARGVAERVFGVAAAPH